MRKPKFKIGDTVNINKGYPDGGGDRYWSDNTYKNMETRITIINCEEPIKKYGLKETYYYHLEDDDGYEWDEEALSYDKENNSYEVVDNVFECW